MYNKNYVIDLALGESINPGIIQLRVYKDKDRLFGSSICTTDLIDAAKQNIPIEISCIIYILGHTSEYNVSLLSNNKIIHTMLVPPQNEIATQTISHFFTDKDVSDIAASFECVIYGSEPTVCGSSSLVCESVVIELIGKAL